MKRFCLSAYKKGTLCAADEKEPGLVRLNSYKCLTLLWYYGALKCLGKPDLAAPHLCNLLFPLLSAKHRYCHTQKEFWGKAQLSTFSCQAEGREVREIMSVGGMESHPAGHSGLGVGLAS